LATLANDAIGPEQSNSEKETKQKFSYSFILVVWIIFINIYSNPNSVALFLVAIRSYILNFESFKYVDLSD
jgi:hypothetical protein